jgi:hypothetical protein
MIGRDPDRIIDEWLRDELDAVPQPTRALAEALEAATVTPQRRGRLFWLRQLLGLEAATIEHGSQDRPEVVLTPVAQRADGSGVLARQGAIATPLVLTVVVVALAVIGAAAWLTVGPGRELIAGGDAGQPLRPIDGSGPVRVIAVDPVDGHFATLAQAVAEAEPGDRIELYAGIHQAEVVVTKDIEIVGVGDRESVVVEPLPLAEGEALGDRLRILITLQDSDAILRGFTLRGSDNGTAAVIIGGSPTLEDLLIDPVGDMSTGSPDHPREALGVRGGASPTVRASEVTSLSYVEGGSTPVFEDVDFRRGCLLVQDAGTSPTVRGSDFTDSACPGFSISVADGAHLEIAAAAVASLPGNTGIRVANEGSSANVNGTSVSGGLEGVLVGPGAAVTVERSNVQGADLGIRVQDGELVLSNAAVVGNRIGLQVGGASFLEVSDTDICNDLNFDLRDGAEVPPDVTPANRICVEGSGEPATDAGT